MTAALATALAVLLGNQWLAGSAVDLDPTLLPAAAAVLLASVGLGVVWRCGATAAAPRLLPVLLLVALALLRGPLCDLVFALSPADVPTALVAALVSLGPAGFCLGRVLGAALGGGQVAVLLGACLGQGLVLLGAADTLPATLSAVVMIAALWALARRRARSRVGRPIAAAAAQSVTRVAELPATESAVGGPAAIRVLATSEARYPAHALLIGAATGLLALLLRRVVPAYVEPSQHAVSDVLLALLLPAALVGWPAAALAGEGFSRRVVAATGGALLAVAATITVASLGLYENAMAQVALTRDLHAQASRWAPLLIDWSVWLLSFAGVVAAALGVACGALRGRAAIGLFAIGAGLAAAAEQWLTADAALAVTAPSALGLAAGGLAALSAFVALLPRAGWLLLPIVAVPFLRWPEAGEDLLRWRTPPDFTAVRRPGEFGIDAFQRDALADVTVFITPGPDSHAIEGREAWRSTCTDRAPVVFLTPAGTLGVQLSGGETVTGATGADGAAGGSAADPLRARHVGVRLGGIALHAGQEPLGEEGSVGRLTRLLASKGRLFVTGVGAELIAADLHDAGVAESIEVSSPIPIGRMPLNVLLDDLGTKGWQAGSVDAPALAARHVAQAGFDSVIVAPARSGWIGSGAPCAEESLRRLAGLLRPAGRCLLWLDTTDLTSAALRARLAAFADVFGERSAAFVEMRELDPPFVLLLGWRDEPGRPQAADLLARLPWPDATGRRSRLSSLEDLGAMLLRDGAGMTGAGWAAATRDRPMEGGVFGNRGWEAVASVRDAGARLSTVVSGAPDAGHRSDELFLGLAAHARYDYDLMNLNETLLEIKRDVNWDAFAAEVGHYRRAAAEDHLHPLLHQALAALLEPLAVSGDYGRFAKTFQDCGGATMPSWRLALLESWVEQSSLEKDMASAALERARTWRRAGSTAPR